LDDGKKAKMPENQPIKFYVLDVLQDFIKINLPKDEKGYHSTKYVYKSR
jgi:hypothetical protein